MIKLSARQTAIQILDKADLRKGILGEILGKIIQQTQQRAACTDIVNGTVRNLTAIELVISKISGLPIEKINKRLINPLRCAVYEMFFCNTADYAVVNEYVELVKQRTGKKGGGFVNAVLRNILRHCEKNNNTSQIKFDINIFADKTQNQSLYLSQFYSLPKWLIDGWIKNYGLDAVENICIASNRRPNVYAFANQAKTDMKNLCKLFTENKIDYEQYDIALRLKSPSAIDKLAGFEQGLFYIQDITATKMVKSIPLKGSEVVLDLCSAPGGKTIGLSPKVSKIFATDFDSDRLKKVSQNCQRLGLNNVSIIEYSQLSQVGKADIVIADVPCSNTGVLAKRADARWRLDKNSISKIIELQMDIICKAADFVKQDGLLCYSTCSIEKQENQNIIQNFLNSNTAFTLQKEELTLPTEDSDGGYFAIMQKS